MIEEKVKANGGEYVGDLSKKVTHLITYKPEGKKYKAAINWGIRAVSIEWLHDSVERGMILNEDCYDPTLPREERGVGAWTRKEVRRDTTGKRLRDDATAAVAAQGRRKLRKTASMKLISQNESLWGDILNQQSSANQSKVELGGGRSSLDGSHVAADESMVSVHEEPTQKVETVPTIKDSERSDAGGGIFASCRFFVHEFTPARAEIVRDHLISNGGRISPSIEDLASSTHPEPSTKRFLVVTQMSQPDSHPSIPEGVHIVTEFYIERCLLRKQLSDPNEHVLGRPFPRFPIPGFEELTVCTTGFKLEGLLQVYRTISQLGARYEERFNAGASLLVTPSLDHVHKGKLDFARRSGIPVVDAEWLWQCIATGFLVPWDKYLLQKLEKPAEVAEKQNSTVNGTTSSAVTKEQQPEKRRTLQKTTSEPVSISTKASNRREISSRAPPPPKAAGVDRTAFEDDGPTEMIEDSVLEAGESHYDTAPTHQPLTDIVNTTTDRPESASGRTKTAFEDVSSNVLTKSPLSLQQKAPEAEAGTSAHRATRQKSDRHFKRIPTGGTIADSDGGDSVSTSRHGTEPPDEEVASAAAARRREREKQDKATREKEEMSRRLSSLMSSHNATGNDNSDGGSSGVAFDDGPGAEGGGASASGSRPQRRKREILGRAISNVSAASSNASGESSPAPAGVPNANLKTPAVAGSFASASGNSSGAAMQQLFDKMLDSPAEEQRQGGGDGERGRGQGPEAGSGTGSGREDGNPPPATQLGYDVPEARHHRAAIMDRILRRKGGGKKAVAEVGSPGTAGAGLRRSQEKVTLASMSVGMAGAGGDSSAAPSTTTTRRTTRRQKGF